MAAELQVELTNELSEIRRLSEIVEDFAGAHDFPPRIVYNLNLCLDELITNIVGYAYDDQSQHAITVRLTLADGVLRTEVEDDGRPFNPLEEAPEPDLEAEVDGRPVGGLGIHFVKTLMDEVSYQRDDGRNRLIMTKRIAG